MNKSVVKFETVVAALSVVLWAIMLAMSFGIAYPTSARFLTGGGAFPFLLCVILIILNVIWMINNFQILRHQEGDPQSTPLLTYLFGTREQFRRLVLIALLVLLYVFALIPLAGMVHPTYGFAMATAVYLIISIKIFGNLSWAKTILVSVVVTGLVFFAMNNMLMLPMPK